MPIAERQSQLIGEALRGAYALPRGARWSRHRRQAPQMKKRYVASKRHTIQVDYDDYMKGLSAELEAGRERADAAAPVGSPVAV